MDEKKVREAIKEFEIEVQVFEDMISYCKYFEPKNDCGRYEKKIAMRKTAIEALEKQLPKKLVEHHYEEEGEEPYIKMTCPNGCKFQPSRSSKYCRECGQKLDWRK